VHYRLYCLYIAFKCYKHPLHFAAFSISTVYELPFKKLFFLDGESNLVCQLTFPVCFALSMSYLIASSLKHIQKINATPLIPKMADDSRESDRFISLFLARPVSFLGTGSFLVRLGEVAIFIFSHLQCKTLLKIWWGQYFSRINIKKLSLTSVHTLWKSDTPIFPQNAHHMKKY